MISRILKTLSDNLQTLMVAHRLTQVQLGKKTDVAQKTISNAKNQVGAAGIDTVEALAGGLDLPAWVLLVDQVDSMETANRITGIVRRYLDSDPEAREKIAETAEAEHRHSETRKLVRV